MIRTLFIKNLKWILVGIVLNACAVVQPWEKEFLADPLMGNESGDTKLSLEEKFFSTQEGSAGSTDGMAGGCGCAK